MDQLQIIQNRIYELKDKIGEEYTVEEVLNILLDEFANLEIVDDFVDYLEI